MEAGIHVVRQEDAIGDDALIKRFVSEKHGESFEKLILRHLTGLRRLLYGILNGNREDMEDAEQEILTGLFLDLGKFRFQSSFKTYLYRYARNKACDIIRKKKREERKILQFGRSKAPKHTEEPLERILKQEEGNAMKKALFSLPEEERSLLIMKDVEKLSIEKIASIMNIAEGTVKSRLHRTREKIVNFLKEATS
ncbi:MAG: RNA polymerase sigma factor [Spirochaetales bacterium]|nr:RNA polymerase sigma factor [Spirochaetales bacterium]